MFRIFPFIAAISFVATLISTPWLIRYFKSIGLTAKDQHKIGMWESTRSGGVPVMLGIFAGVLTYIFFRTFVMHDSGQLIYLLAAITTMLIITFIGFIDDLSIRLVRAFKEKDIANCKETVYVSHLRQWQKALMVLPAAIPLMAVMAGTTNINLPFFGNVELGILYPLVLIPLGVFGAANMVNMLEGLNGLGSGMGMIYTGMLGLYAVVNSNRAAAIIAFAAFGALAAFWKFHKTPAKMQAGDSLTYLLGAVIACIAILGNMEKAALVAAIPFFIEFILKARGKFQKTTVGFINEKTGFLESKYEKIYSIPHIFMRKKCFTEKEIVYAMMVIEFIFAGLIWFI